MQFLKGHGTRNDFVILPDHDGLLDVSPALVRVLCDRRGGIGGDGVLHVVPTRSVPEVAGQADVAEWFMDYRNGDGSIAEMCGNGIRVFARYLVQEGLAKTGEFAVATRAGVKTICVPEEGDISVNMGVPELLDLGQVTVRANGRSWSGTSVSMGNPHVVVPVSDLQDAGNLLDMPTVDPPGAFPNGVNYEFVVGRGRGRIAMRVRERGAGETQSCGTGTCAAAVAAARWWSPPRPFVYDVDVPGGRVRVAEQADGSLILSGPAEIVASGTIDDEWLAERLAAELAAPQTAAVQKAGDGARPAG
ncbi:MAG: diaminopimelate epimerase [Frankiaceae bacterium]|nr:diaminopimelate epimerase [Frankiaceae bacterium]